MKLLKVILIALFAVGLVALGAYFSREITSWGNGIKGALSSLGVN